MKHYAGRCLCGLCQYVVTGTPEAMYLCHCSRCRKETGSSHGANIFLKNAQLSWNQGGNNIAYFQLQGTRKERAFCVTCGSPLPRQDNSQVIIPAGTLDEDCSLDPTAHIYYESRAAWEDKLSSTIRFAALPCDP